MRRVSRTTFATALIFSVSFATSIPVAAATPPSPQKNVKSYTFIGQLKIGRLKLNSPIYSGITMDVFAKGMGYWPGSALPGEVGNVVLAGHRTSNPRPLYDIQMMKVGDAISIVRLGRTYTYKVTGTRIVSPSSVWITRQSSEATLTMFACHPRGSIKSRFVVFAKLQT